MTEQEIGKVFSDLGLDNEEKRQKYRYGNLPVYEEGSPTMSLDSFNVTEGDCDANME